VPGNAHKINETTEQDVVGEVYRTVYKDANAAQGKKCAYLCDDDAQYYEIG